MVKLPWPPDPERLAIDKADLHTIDVTALLWRLHSTRGVQARPWNQLRHDGPTTARFDPHLPPRQTQERAVLYAATTVATAVAEAFQRTRTINLNRKGPYLTAWRPTRPMQVLDLTGSWPIRNGASHVVNTGPHHRCQAWARAVRSHWVDLDGMRHASAMTGEPCVTLFDAAADTIPALPELSVPLNHPGWGARIEEIAATIGYAVL